MKSIGVDIGASHISCGLFNHDLNKLECKLYYLNKMDTTIDIDISTEYFINLIINLIDKMIQENKIDITQVSSIGLGCPGGVDKKNGIFLGSSSLNVHNINFKKELKKYNVPVFIENDCTCAGICESYINNITNFIMFTLGSGLGISYMYNYNCIDEIVWDISKINKKVGINHDSYIKSFNSLSKKYNIAKNHTFSRGKIFDCLAVGDRDAQIILKDYISNFIDGIKNIQKYYNITTFSIGGGMSEYSRYFIKEIQYGLPNVNILIAKFKNDSGIIGGALLEKII